jgi:hypothetical protein
MDFVVDRCAARTRGAAVAARVVVVADMTVVVVVVLVVGGPGRIVRAGAACACVARVVRRVKSTDGKAPGVSVVDRGARASTRSVATGAVRARDDGRPGEDTDDTWGVW